VIRTFKATVRALYSAVEVVGVEGSMFVVSAPSEMHKKKCLEWKSQVCEGLTKAAGRTIDLDVRVQTPRNSTPSSGTTRPVNSSIRTPSKDDDAVDADDTDVPGDDDSPVESVVDQIARSFPGARVVDSSQN